MGMSASGSRRGKRRRAMSDINVVPYIDVMLVLLIIFMVTAPLLNLGVDIELPKSNAKSLDQKVEHLSDKQVYLRGDGTVTYQELMEVFDKLKGAGVANVGLVTRMEGQR